MSTVVNAPKTDTYHFRINPTIRDEAEAVFAKNGLNLTQAINIFIQQSLNVGGLPFSVSAENAELIRAQAAKRLLAELDAGKASGTLLDENAVYEAMGVERL